MVGRGRPPIGPNVTCRYPPDVLAALDRLAARYGITRAELLRRLALAHVSKQEWWTRLASGGRTPPENDERPPCPEA